LDRWDKDNSRQATALREPELAAPTPTAPEAGRATPRTFEHGGHGGLRVGRRGRRGAKPPRAPLVLARLLPHLLVLLIVGAVVAGEGFWDPALRTGRQFESGTTVDLSVPLNVGSLPGAPAAPPEREPGTGYFTRPPLAVTTLQLRVATYETRANETPTQVAGRFGLKPTTILWANGLQDPLKPLPAGTKLRVPPADGMLHQVQGNDTLAAIAAKYKVETTAITGYRANNVGGPDDLVPNSYLLVVGGQIPTRERIEQYVVANGDTLWSIAERFGLKPSTIVWANSLTNADVLAIGQPLIIPPINGVIHRIGAGETLDTVAERYGVKPAEIAAFAPNGLGGASPLVPGQDIIVPGGTPPAPTPPILAESPPAADPAPAAASAAPASAAATSGTTAVGSFIWPATGALTTYFGENPAYYGPGGHNGLDIANSLGTPLLAADGGVVIYAAWKGGLGNAVGIDHENGFVTWYGHASSFATSVGQRVSRGQVVAYMGSTGNSTGSHIHFIIVRNDVYVDPLGYLPR
jgi:murein DD-endopeptidase MepM/ murein hydrolase activator NlpD